MEAKLLPLSARYIYLLPLVVAIVHLFVASFDGHTHSQQCIRYISIPPTHSAHLYNLFPYKVHPK